MLKAVLDTNVIVSALNFGGNPLLILELARRRTIQLFLSEAIFEETALVLELKLGWKKQETSRALHLIRGFSTIVAPIKQVAIIRAKKSDNRILECAMEAGADYLVTGDAAHILPLKKIGKTLIVNPAEFIAVWRGSNPDIDL